MASAILRGRLSQANAKIHIVQRIVAFLSRERVAYNGIGNAEIVMHTLVIEFASPCLSRLPIPGAASDLNGKVFLLIRNSELSRVSASASLMQS